MAPSILHQAAEVQPRGGPALGRDLFESQAWLGAVEAHTEAHRTPKPVYVLSSLHKLAKRLGREPKEEVVSRLTLLTL